MSVEYEIVAGEGGHRPEPPRGSPSNGSRRTVSARNARSPQFGKSSACTHETYKKICELVLPTRDAGPLKTIDEQIDELVLKLKERLKDVEEGQRDQVVSAFLDEAFSCPEERTCFAESDNRYGGPGVTDARHKHVISRLEKRLRSVVEWSELRIPTEVLRRARTRADGLKERVDRLVVVEDNSPGTRSPGTRSPRQSWGSGDFSPRAANPPSSPVGGLSRPQPRSQSRPPPRPPPRPPLSPRASLPSPRGTR